MRGRVGADGRRTTLRDFDAGRREPSRNKLTATRVALEEGGVSFFDDHKESGIKGPALDRNRWR